MLAPEERFWSKVDVRGPDDCWEWTAGRGPYGYGMVSWAHPKGRNGQRMTGAHRVALALSGDGTFPQGRTRGLDAAHSCDNPPCCNPKHLRWMTPEENNEEKKERGLSPRGTPHRHTVSHDDALAIRRRAALGEPNVTVALAFGLTRWAVGDIVNGRTHRFTFDPELYEAALRNRVEQRGGRKGVSRTGRKSMPLMPTKLAETTEPVARAVPKQATGTVSEVGREAASSHARSGSEACYPNSPSLPAPSSQTRVAG